MTCEQGMLKLKLFLVLHLGAINDETPALHVFKTYMALINESQGNPSCRHILAHF